MGPLKEGQTPINEEEVAGLKIKTIRLQSQLDFHELNNIVNARRWLTGKQLPPETILSEKFIRDLHRRMFRDVWKWAGQFRRSEKNIGVRWVTVPRELRVLCDDAQFWVANRTFGQRELALRFKHRLVSIHCFPNGNGRHSRMVADALLENGFGQPPFRWGAELPAGEARRRYITSLRAADNGDFRPLLDFA